MPLDKSRIQGFGSDGPAQPESSSWFGSYSSESAPVPAAAPKKCPQGHNLVLWSAKPGWCDGCGNKIKGGQPVMDCRTCNYYLCKNCAPQDEAQEDSSFWGAMSSLTDMGSTPAVNSAIDNVALRFGDVIDAATQDMSEMASDFKSFMASAIGLDEDEEEEEMEAQQRQAAAIKKNMEKVSPRSRQEAVQVIADFCEKYPAARVRPNLQELEKLWATVSVLKASPLIGAIYDQLSFGNGDTSWQPRLRILYALEYLYRKGGLGKEVTMAVFHQSRSIIQHLVEVQQCADKAFELVNLITGKTQEDKADSGAQADDEGRSQAEAPPAAKPAKKEAAQDLLDMAAPVTTTTAAAPATAASNAAAVDLLAGSSSAPAAAPAAATSALPQDLDLFSPAPASASTAPVSRPAAAPDPFDPNQQRASAAAFAPAASGGFGAFGGGMCGTMGMPGIGQAMPMGGGGLASVGGAALGAAPAFGGAFGGPMGGAGAVGATNGMGAMGGGMGAMGGGMGAMGGMGTGGAIGCGGGYQAPVAGGSGPSSGCGGRSAPSALSSNGSGSAGAKAMGLPYIPAASELTPLSSNAPKDPFSFLTEMTGIGDAPAAK